MYTSLGALAFSFCTLLASACAQNATQSANHDTKIRVMSVIFSENGKIGDYAWMRNQPEYIRAYFVFNDNEEQFLIHEKDPKNNEGCAAGGGNAGIRPWQCEMPARADGGTNRHKRKWRIHNFDSARQGDYRSGYYRYTINHRKK